MAARVARREPVYQARRSSERPGPHGQPLSSCFVATGVRVRLQCSRDGHDAAAGKVVGQKVELPSLPAVGDVTLAQGVFEDPAETAPLQ